MYILEYYVKNKGVFFKRFSEYPTDEQLHFLIVATDIYYATIWKQGNGGMSYRIIDLI